jgi:hypothetical protein
MKIQNFIFKMPVVPSTPFSIRIMNTSAYRSLEKGLMEVQSSED